ncbi:hypothetical protein N9060_00630 [Arenicella sp.]|nr:hypothetical protein [Arenicella sp.]
MNTKLPFLLLIMLTALSACGGGNSSSGSGKSVAMFDDDGEYVGSQSVTLATLGGELIEEFGIDFNMSVFQNEVTISDGSFIAQAQINDGIFIASSGQFALAEEDITCDVSVIYNGTVGMGSAQGTIRGNYQCSYVYGPMAGTDVNFPIVGDFDGVRGSVSSKISLINTSQVNLSSLLKVIRNRQ